LCAFEEFGSSVAENYNDSRRRRLISVLNSTKDVSFNPEEFFEVYGHQFQEMFF